MPMSSTDKLREMSLTYEEYEKLKEDCEDDNISNDLDEYNEHQNYLGEIIMNEKRGDI